MVSPPTTGEEDVAVIHHAPPTETKSEGGLAQTFAKLDNQTCTSTPERNKATLDDFYGLLDSGAQYSDGDFTPDESSLYWTGMSEGAPQSFAGSSVSWQRASEIFGSHTLFGEDGVTVEDINQGSLGNCWFLSGASALAEVPGRIERVFLNTELNDAGIYAVNFYTLGVPHTVIIDDYLPMVSHYGGQYSTLFAAVSDDSALWGPLLEKAFAKYHGNYLHIEAGNPMYSARTLSGAPFESLWHSDTDMETLWSRLQAHDNDNDIIQAGTPGTSDSYTNADGLVQSHAYVVIGVVTLGDGTRLVKLRNPWG